MTAKEAKREVHSAGKCNFDDADSDRSGDGDSANLFRETVD